MGIRKASTVGLFSFNVTVKTPAVRQAEMRDAVIIQDVRCIDKQSIAKESDPG